ncbi:hypothetical protein GR212_31400 [Rhizobium lusitanum]|uniref:Uncharacterized protein n=1 Tax=Rhizobium lusitanum TaxID=293958 RepID=A0A6L9UHI1_9HYPH|nr:hypothetical protein [Rhizobium lusitanum]NEI74068.1 hypothetical protein [Rhizobium lusitanum]
MSTFECDQGIGAIFLSTLLSQVVIVASEYRMDRTKLNITFDRDPDWLSKRTLQTAYLAIAQSDKLRPIFIHLQGRPGSKELFELAAEAMADYSRYRASQRAR